MSHIELIKLRAHREILLLQIYRIDREIARIARAEGLTYSDALQAAQRRVQKK